MSDTQPVQAIDLPGEKGLEGEDTVEIPLNDVATSSVSPKDLPATPIAEQEPPDGPAGVNESEAGDKTIGGDRLPGDTGKDTPPPPPPPKLSPETPAKPTLPRGSSMQEIELSRAPTPQEANGNGPVPTINRPQSSTSSRHQASASVTSLASASVASPSRPNSAFRPRMTSEHSRRSSVATTISLAGNGGGQGSGSRPPQLSSVLITPPLKVLVDSKEAKKSASFSAAAQRALELCSQEGPSNSAYLHPREIFEPLRLAISNPQTTSVPTLITSLDLLSKLVSHSFFSEPDGPPKGQSPLPDLITHTITLAYSETSPPQVALQVVKALMAIVLSTDKGMMVHQSSLLKAVRTVYNVFLLSNDAPNQIVAQGGLTQMVHHVFQRVVRPSTGLRDRRGTVSENEARRLEKEAIDEAARLAADANGEGEQNGTTEPKLTL
jgi:brefeldin A-inhibited guanine nucleotide-exchange protein